MFNVRGGVSADLISRIYRWPSLLASRFLAITLACRPPQRL
jgi:hypothetical protein